MQQPDAPQFIEAILKKIFDHKSRHYWGIVCSTAPPGAQDNSDDLELQVQTLPRRDPQQAQSTSMCSWQHATMGHFLLGSLFPGGQYSLSPPSSCPLQHPWPLIKIN
jgi:hypothetical protein